MSFRQALSKGPSLPKDLLNQLGLANSSSKNKSKFKPKGRKEIRKAARVEKKKHRPQHRPVQHQHKTESSNVIEDEDDDNDNDEEEEEDFFQESDEPDVDYDNERLSKRAKLSKTDDKPLPKKRSAALVQDDMEIAYLEKKLGLKGKSKSKALEEDGLADLLQGIDDAVTGEDEQEDIDWLRRKRKVYEKQSSPSDSEEEDLFDSDDDPVTEESDVDEEMEGLDEIAAADGDDDIFSSNDEDEEFDDHDVSESKNNQVTKVKENPYKPPLEATQKYIPPSLRAPAKEDEQLLIRLRRQLQGLLNRLSESNILSIVKEIDQIFTNNPRQQTITSLIDILMLLICDPTILMDTFLILHAGFISAMYKTLGSHFGAQFLERFVSEFSKFYEDESKNTNGSKETSSMISLIADLYSFQMVNHNIMYDYIKLLCIELTDLNAELLLRLIKSCGPQLRADNPSALKDVIILVQNAVAKKGEANLPVRTKFMIETIMNLKNNKTKNIGSQLATETIVRMKKTIGSLNSRNLKGIEPLGIGLKDIQQADKGGKWWLVGASWNNTVQKQSQDNVVADQEESDHETSGNGMAEETILAGEATSAELSQLAKEHRMNTDIRRAIFTTTLSAADYKDCHLRLKRIGLNKKQQLEIPRILVYCTTIEDAYNPFYRLIAEQMCAEHRFRKAFEFNFWSTLNKLGESPDLDSDYEDDQEGRGDVSITEVVNIGKMYGEMIASMSLPITILKILKFMYLQPKTKTLIEVLLVSMFQAIDKKVKSDSIHEQKIVDIFSKAKEAPQLTTGLRFFIPTVVKSSALVTSSKHKKALKKNCRLAMDILAVIHTATAT